MRWADTASVNTRSLAPLTAHLRGQLLDTALSFTSHLPQVVAGPVNLPAQFANLFEQEVDLPVQDVDFYVSPCPRNPLAVPALLSPA